MFLHRLIYLLKQRSTYRQYKKILILLATISLLVIVSLGLFWFEYTGRDEQLANQYPALKFISRLPKILDLYYLPLMFRSSTLPQYSIEINKKHLDNLEKNLPLENCCECLSDTADAYMPAKFVYNQQTYDVEIKVRGACANHWANQKKSWRIKFDKDKLFNGQKYFDLILPDDREFVAEYLNTYRAKKLGLIMPEMQFVTLRLNGSYYGVYLQEERLSEDMLAKNQQNADDNIYGDDKINRHLFTNPTFWKKYNQDSLTKFDNYAELKTLLDLINHTSDEEFFAQIPNLLDMDNFYRWYVLSNLADSYRQDFAHNMRLYFDSASGKFRLIPNDVGSPVTAAIDVIHNPLVTRIMKNPAFVAARNKILWDYVKDDNNLADDLAYFDRAYEQIKWPAYRDFSNTYSNFYFDKKIKLRRQHYIDTFQRLRETLQQGDKISAIIDVSDNLTNTTNYQLLSQLDFIINNFSGVNLNNITIKLNATSTAAKLDHLVLFYDTNKNNILDSSDINVNNFKVVENKLIADHVNYAMLTDREVPDKIDYTAENFTSNQGLFFKPINPQLTTHRFFIASTNRPSKPFAKIFDKFSFKLTNAITGDEIESASKYIWNKL